MNIQNIDSKLISFYNKITVPMARFGLFVVFFWFGFLKIIGLSPASGLVQRLFEQTISFMSFDMFLILFGIFECLIGILFLIPKVERVVWIMLLLHMITTFMPLFILSQETWSAFMVPTLEGQYIIKNLLIIASALAIMSRLQPLQKDQTQASL